MKLKTLRRLLQVSLLLSLPLVSYRAGAAPAAPVVPAGGAVAAEVNGEKIYKADLDRTIAMVKEREPAFAANTAETQKSLASLRASFLDSFIERLLFVQEARKRNIVPVKADVDKALAEYQAEYASEAEFKKALAEEGKTPDDVRRRLSEEMALSELTSRLTADIQVTDAEVRKYYADNPVQIPEAVRARHIVLSYPQNATAAQKKEVRTKGEELLKKAAAKGADFSKLARENSDDVGTKDVGGDLGFAARGTFPKALEDVTFTAPVGLVNRLVESEFGLHIIRVEQKEAARTLKYEDIVKGSADFPEMRLKLQQLRQDVRLEKTKNLMDKTLAELKAKAVIKKY